MTAKRKPRPTRAQTDRIDINGMRFVYVPEYASLFVHFGGDTAEFGRKQAIDLRNFLNDHVGDGTVDAEVAPGAVTAEEFQTLEDLERRYAEEHAAAEAAPPPLSRDEQHKLLSIATMRHDRMVQTLVSDTDTMELDLEKRGYLARKSGRHGTRWVLTEAGRAWLGKPAVSR